MSFAGSTTLSGRLLCRDQQDTGFKPIWLKRRSGWKRHLLEAKSPKRRRKLRKASLIAKVDVPRLKRLVPYL